MSKSELEEQFLAALSRMYPGLDLPDREYRFERNRRWRFDFAWPIYKVAVEIQGGQFVRGSHLRPLAFESNCDKYNQAASSGWTIFLLTTNHIRERLAESCEMVVDAVISRRNKLIHASEDDGSVPH